MAPCALVAALFAATAALLQLAAHLPAAADGAATLARDSVVEGAEGAEGAEGKGGAAGKGGVACVQGADGADVPRARRGESGDGGSGAPRKIPEVGRGTC